MDIREIHEFIEFLANTTQSRYFEPEEKDLAINSAQIDKFNEEKKRFMESRFIGDNLRKFVVNSQLTNNSLSDDYDTIISAASDVASIDIIEEYEWDNRLRSSIDPPNLDYPIGIVRKGSFITLPDDINEVSMTYIKAPSPVKWGYTISGDNLVYNQSLSSDLEWPESAHNDIVLRACHYLGIPINDQAMMTLKMYKKQTEDV